MAQLKPDSQINQEVGAGRGKSTGWPSCLTYSLNKRVSRIILTGKINKQNLRIIDCWGLAFFDHCQKFSQKPPNILKIEVPRKPTRRDYPHFEALLRRVSYLNLDDRLKVDFVIDGRKQSCYSLTELIKRPSNEIIRTGYNERSDDDEPGRLEKDFQAYLFGKGKKGTDRTNERLAILGEDFRDLNRKKVPFTMEREFPTGVFDGKVSANTRILPTNFIDVVSFNKWQKLSLIELKVNDSGLPVISQSVDYALFFASYQRQLWDVLEKKLERRPKKKEFVLYIANNCFHQRFDDVAKYYSPAGKQVPFTIKKVVLGGTVEI